MANKLMNKILSTFQYIRINNLFNEEDSASCTTCLGLLEELADDLGIINIDKGQDKGESHKDLEFRRANRFINYEYLEVAIKNDPYFVKEKNKYLQDIKERFEPEFLMLQGTISDYHSIIKKIKKSDDIYWYDNRKEKGVMLLNLIEESVLETLKELDTNPKSKRLTHPQRILLLDKLGFITLLYDRKIDIKSMAELISILLNEDKDNTRSYLTFGSSLSDAKGNIETEKKYNYKNSYHIKIVDNVLRDLNLL